MKKLLLYTIIGTLFAACTPDEENVLDLSVAKDEIKKIELRTDHKTLIPGGNATMEFHVVAYGERKAHSVYLGDDKEFHTNPDSLIEYEIPQDLIPNSVKLYDENGAEIKNMVYKTATDAPGTVKHFQAKLGDIESNRIDITLRPILTEEYAEVVVPVVFHLLVPHASKGPAYTVSEQYLEEALQHASDIFNRRITTDPNGGNAKVSFRLAEFQSNSGRMPYRGRTITNLTISETPDADAGWDTKRDSYKALILKKKLVWDPNKYLNIWLCYFSDGINADGGRSAITTGPGYIVSEEAKVSVPGFTFKVAPSISTSDITDCTQAGILTNYQAFFNPNAQGGNAFQLATYFGQYFGLLFTDQDANENFKDGDNDYCADTYFYYSGYSDGIYKNTRLYKEDAEAEYEWFTSYNIMDAYSRKSSVSADQANRVRKVMEVCPDRWCWKTQWAFTGKDN